MDRLLTLKEVAELTGLSIRTLYDRLAPEGDIPVVRMGTGRRPRVRVKESDLEAWIDARRSVPADRPGTVVKAAGVRRVDLRVAELIERMGA